MDKIRLLNELEASLYQQIVRLLDDFQPLIKGDIQEKNPTSSAYWRIRAELFAKIRDHADTHQFIGEISATDCNSTK